TKRMNWHYLSSHITTSVSTMRFTYKPWAVLWALRWHPNMLICLCQATRYHRICSDPNGHNSHLNVLSQSMRQKGYKPKTITKQINSAEIWKIIKDLQPILTEDETLKNIFPETPILAFRQPPNLQQKLINRRLPTDGKNEENGTSQCKKPRCNLCQHICTDNTATHNNKTYSIKGSYSCTSSNV
ncbi:Hypothetical predicted protein, partial [Pelobates cultripes]